MDFIITESELSIIKGRARKYANYNLLDREDAIQEGMIALFKNQDHRKRWTKEWPRLFSTICDREMANNLLPFVMELPRNTLTILKGTSLDRKKVAIKLLKSRNIINKALTMAKKKDMELHKALSCVALNEADIVINWVGRKKESIEL